MLRLVLVSLGIGACSGADVTTYADNDPPISNGGSGGGCMATAFTVTPVVPYVQLVLDASGSMDNGIGGSSDSKYITVRDILTNTTNGLLLALQAKAQFGITIFTGQSSCPKLFTQPPAPGNAAAIRSEFSQTSPQGNDQLATVINNVVAGFVAPAGAKRVIVIATDDVPNNCDDSGDHTSEAVTATKAAFTAGISTYVIGIKENGNNVPSSFLQPMANAGLGNTTATSSPTYAAGTATDITTDYTTIFNQILDCKLTLDGTIDVAQASLGTVTSNGAALVYSTDWTAVDAHTIQLIGAACTAYNAASPAPAITATFTCGSSH